MTHVHNQIRLELSEPEHFVVRSWLAECVWIAPDTLLDDLIALKKHVAPSNPVDLTTAQAWLLLGYLEFVSERPTAAQDLPVLDHICDILANEL